MPTLTISSSSVDSVPSGNTSSTFSTPLAASSVLHFLLSDLSLVVTATCTLSWMYLLLGCSPFILSPHLPLFCPGVQLLSFSFFYHHFVSWISCSPPPPPFDAHVCVLPKICLSSHRGFLGFGFSSYIAVYSTLLSRPTVGLCCTVWGG